MSQLIYINDILIPDSDIIRYPISTEHLEYDGKIISDSYVFEIDNTDPSVYDDRYEGSFFYGVTFIGDLVEIYDDEINKYIFAGKIKTITISESSSSIEIEAVSSLDDLSDVDCIYTTTGVTPAAAIYYILTNANNGNIDPALISYSGFQDSINVQTAASATIDISYDAEAGKSCQLVISELLRISHCRIRQTQNVIYLQQWKTYSGAIGVQIAASAVVSGTYRHIFSDDKFFTSYRIAYDSGGSILYATGTGGAGGGGTFMVPDEDPETSTSSEVRMLYDNLTGAAWCGAQAMFKYGYLQKYAYFSIDDDYEFVSCGDQIDLRFFPFYGEPTRIVEREYDKNERKIALKVEFLNTPHQFYARDIIPPDSVELHSADGTTGGVYLKWSKCPSVDWVGYKIYFTTTPGEWESEYCNRGQSPADDKSTDLTEDGYIDKYIMQLNTGSTYYFYITQYDSSYNESDPSNILSAVVL